MIKCKFISNLINMALLSVIIFKIESKPGLLNKTPLQIRANKLDNFPKINTYIQGPIPVAIKNAEQNFSVKAKLYKNEINNSVFGPLRDCRNEMPFKFNNKLNINSLDMKHIALGHLIETEKEYILSGLHVPLYCTNHIQEVIFPEDEQGVKIVKVGDKRLAKLSSMFPVNWNAQMVSDKIIESLITVQGLSVKTTKPTLLTVFGKTSEGIIIESRINNGGKIVTSFPKYNKKWN